MNHTGSSSCGAPPMASYPSKGASATSEEPRCSCVGTRVWLQQLQQLLQLLKLLELQQLLELQEGRNKCR